MRKITNETNFRPFFFQFVPHCLKNSASDTAGVEFLRGRDKGQTALFVSAWGPLKGPENLMSTQSFSCTLTFSQQYEVTYE